jgi:glycogen synthase
MMFGRMDPGQKGFDLLARAIEGFPRGAARFILTPIVGDGTAVFADDLRRLAEQRRGDVAVYPFRMEAGYMEAMAGASFAVMPSFYEPFGAASEAYLAGTPVVARATGGLTDQVADYRVDALKATGFLFREKLPLGSSWPSIMNAATPEQRVEIPLYAMIAEALFDALNQAADLWRHDAPAYARMLQNLYPKAMEFSSERAAGEYAEWYRTATG